MGFFAEGDVRLEPRGKSGAPSTKLLRDLGCTACPLNHAKLLHPKMVPTGNLHPEVLMLGEAPSEDDDKKGAQFVGAPGNYLRPKIPPQYRDALLWDNVLQCRPPGNRNPDPVEMECCRPRHEKAIGAAQPKAIFGFGNIPLQWAIARSGIANWRGRRIPIRVGGHECWFFPFHHPAFLLRARHAAGGSFTEDERMFELDLKRAFAVLPRLQPAHPHTKEFAKADVEIVLNCNDADVLYIEQFLEWAAQQAHAGFDYETFGGLRPYREDTAIATVAVSTAGRTLSFPLDHPGANWSQKNRARVWAALGKFIKAPRVRKAVHNLAFEMEWSGVKLGREYIRAGLWDCTMSQAFVLDQRVGDKGGGDDSDDDGVMECFGLGFLTLLHFGIDIKTLSHVNTKKIMDEPLDAVLLYNGIDAKYHLHLCLAQNKLLREENLTYVYEKVHLPRIATAVLTQMKGLPLDNAVAESLHKKYSSRIAKIGAEIDALPLSKQFFKTRGEKFSPTSNKHMIVVCRDMLKSGAGARKKRVAGVIKESYHVDETTLEQIDHPIGKLVLDLRGASKLDSTYVWPKTSPLVYPDGLLHPMLNSVRTRTARLSSNDPNEQNIPIRDGEQKEVRKQIAAPEGHVLLHFDQGQIEARVFAMASRDKTYTQMLWEDYDIHADEARHLATAYPSRIGGKPFLSDKDVMKKFRDNVKGGWVFALFFGAQLSTAAKQVEIPEEYLKREYERFWRTFQGVKAWQDRNAEFYRVHGYVEALTGRRRCGPLSTNKVINTPIQTTACEIVVGGMDRISEYADASDWSAHPYFNAHDDLGAVAPIGRVDEVAELYIREMTRPAFDFINVPLVVEMKVGANLYDMEVCGKFSTVDWHPEFKQHA